MAFYKQSTAYTRAFKMVDSTDHFSKKTGLTCTVNISKAGGSFGAAAGTVTEVANGWYKVALTTADTGTLGDLAFYITAAGADDTDFVDQVVVRDLADLAYPATSGRSMVIDTAGLVDANMVKAGPTGSGTAQTAKDIGGAVPAAAAGASGGLHILGTNAFAVSYTAGMTFSNTTGVGLTCSSSNATSAGASFAGNTSGAGIISTGGSTGAGASFVGGATSGDGILATGTLLGHGISANATGSNKNGIFAGSNTSGAAAIRGLGSGSGAGMQLNGGGTGIGLKVVGGATSGAGLDISTTSGDGLSITPTAGNAIVATANGTSKHGAIFTGGTAGTSDGVSMVAGTGGVDLRANQTGNITGTLATLTTYTGNTVQTGDAYARLGAPAGASVSADVAAINTKTTNLPASPASTTNITAGVITTVTNLTNAPTAGDLTATMKTSVTTAATAATPTAAAVTGAVGSVTGNVGGNVTGSVGSVVGAIGSVTGLTASDVGAIKAKTDNLPASPAAVGSAMTLTSGYDFAKGTVAMTESYAAQGATMTPVQALYQAVQHLGESSIASTTKTVKKRDAATTAKTFTLNSATAPTSITEAT